MGGVSGDDNDSGRNCWFLWLDVERETGSQYLPLYYVEHKRCSDHCTKSVEHRVGSLRFRIFQVNIDDQQANKRKDGKVASRKPRGHGNK
uniref:Uncharacterized protein n=1 Tax=Salix viminalis TaxID=40686 RepID=A0A6N2KJX4_SALVM